MFRRIGTTWAQEAYLKASNTDNNDQFGFSVAISDESLFVGAPGESSGAVGLNGNQDDNGTVGSGAIYIFP